MEIRDSRLTSVWSLMSFIWKVLDIHDELQMLRQIVKHRFYTFLVGLQKSCSLDRTSYMMNDTNDIRCLVTLLQLHFSLSLSFYSWEHCPFVRGSQRQVKVKAQAPPFHELRIDWPTYLCGQYYYICSRFSGKEHTIAQMGLLLKQKICPRLQWEIHAVLS